MSSRGLRVLARIYLGVCVAYTLIPLVVLGGAAFNDSRLPAIYPWNGFTGRWFSELLADDYLWTAATNTLWIAIGVAALSVPTGTAAAFLLNNVGNRVRSVLYGLFVAPILTPGAVIGISTLLFWKGLGFSPGLHLSTLGQVTYVSTFVMLVVLAQLRDLDRSQEEAALDLGASHGQVLWLVIIPHLRPALIAGTILSFFLSMQDFSVTLFTRGSSETLIVYVASKVRTGLTPSVNALALIMMAVTALGAVLYEVARRWQVRRQGELAGSPRGAGEIEPDELSRAVVS